MKMTENTIQSRWDHYFLRRGIGCSTFWREYLGESQHRILFVLGLGFDPRMCFGLKMLIEASPGSIAECLLIEYEEGENSPSLKYSDRVQNNYDELVEIMGSVDLIRRVKIPMWSADRRRRIGSRRAIDIITDVTIEKFSDIIIDISAMPRGIYFPVIAKVLYLFDNSALESKGKNLHVLVPEQITMDKNIQEDGIDDDATYMHGFASDLVQEATSSVPKIWIPVLGEGKEAQLMRLYDQVRPDEICPLLPSPSVNPRRSDDLVSEYRVFLFDQLGVEPPNFIYASEWNPFEVYRQIYRTVERYNVALKDLGRCKVVVSAVSSKLLSLGALLAAYEAKRKGYMVGISHVETHGYKIQGNIEDCHPELFSLWIAGECYNA